MADPSNPTSASAAAAPPGGPATAGAFDTLLGAHALSGGLDRPVAGRTGVVLTPVAGRCVLNLRAHPERSLPTMIDTVQAALGLALPTAVFGSAYNVARTLRALWIGPGDWLLTCAEGDRAGLETGLRQAREGISGALTDIGHGQAILNLTGARTLDVLAQGCGLDLHRSVFTEGHCAMTELARLRVLIDRVPVRPAPTGGSYDIYVARSYASSLWHFVTTAAIEYGYRVDAGQETSAD